MLLDMFEHPPQTKKTESAASATESQCVIEFGSGFYEILGATVWHDDYFAKPTVLQFVFKLGDGTYGYYVTLNSGFATRYHPVILERAITLHSLHGGRLFSKMGQHASATHKMNAHYRKIPPIKRMMGLLG